MFGYSANEVIGKNVNVLMPEPFHSQHDDYVQHYLDTGIKKVIGIGREVVAQKKNGAQFPVSLSISEVRVDGRRLFTGIVRDLSQQMESKLAAAAMQEKMQARSEYLSLF